VRCFLGASSGNKRTKSLSSCAPVRRQQYEATLQQLRATPSGASTSHAATAIGAAVLDAEDALQSIELEEATLDLDDDDLEDDGGSGGTFSPGAHSPPLPPFQAVPQSSGPPSSPPPSSSDSNGSSSSSSDDDDHSSESSASGSGGDPSDSDDPGDPDDEDVVGEIGVEHPHLAQPAYANSPHTLKASLLLILKHCMDNKLSMTALEHLLQVLAFLLPQPNRIPRSKYKLFQLLGIDVERYERHVCDHDCHVYQPLDPSEYELHQNDACPECQRPRFKRIGATLTPVKKFYAISLQEQVALLKRNPEFDQSAAFMWQDIQSGTADCYTSFWGGTLAEPYVAKMAAGLDDFMRILVFSLGLDGVQVFGHGYYEVWPVGLRLWNLHPQERGKKDFIILAALVPGPKAPKKLSPYLEPLLSEMNRSHHHDGLRTWNESKGAEERLQFCLATTQQDMPALAKSSEHIGPSGRCNCHRCRRPAEPNAGTIPFFSHYYFSVFFFSSLLKTNPLPANLRRYWPGQVPRGLRGWKRFHSCQEDRRGRQRALGKCRRRYRAGNRVRYQEAQPPGHDASRFRHRLWPHDRALSQPPDCKFSVLSQKRLRVNSTILLPLELPQNLLEAVHLQEAQARYSAAGVRDARRPPTHLQPENFQCCCHTRYGPAAQGPVHPENERCCLVLDAL